MNGYYQETDISKAYLVAADLDPRLKLRYFEKHWRQDWLVGLRETLEEHTETFVRAMKIDVVGRSGLADRTFRKRYSQQRSA